MAEQTMSKAPGGFIDRCKTYARTLDGQATLSSLVICGISAIFMVQILPATNIMGALGVLSIYFVVMLMVTGIARMVLRRFRRQ